MFGKYKKAPRVEVVKYLNIFLRRVGKTIENNSIDVLSDLPTIHQSVVGILWLERRDVSVFDIQCRDVTWFVPTLDVISDVKSNIISGVELDVMSGIKSDGESNTKFNIESIKDFPEKMSKLSPKANSLSVIIRSYKSSVTRWCKQNNYDNFGWQSRFYEHIIRNDGSIDKIRQYIINNPSQWSIDRHNPVHSDSKFF
jgi:hypothetical protein